MTEGSRSAKVISALAQCASETTVKAVKTEITSFLKKKNGGSTAKTPSKKNGAGKKASENDGGPSTATSADAWISERNAREAKLRDQVKEKKQTSSTVAKDSKQQQQQQQQQQTPKAGLKSVKVNKTPADAKMMKTPTTAAAVHTGGSTPGVKTRAKRKEKEARVAASVKKIKGEQLKF